MAGRRRGDHILREKIPATGRDELPATKYIAWCGEWQFSQYGMEGLPWGINACTKCSAKFYAARLKAAPNGYSLEKLELPAAHNDPEVYGFGRYGWKSVYMVRRDADQEPVAFVGIETGWGESWKVFGLEAPLTVGMMRDGAAPTIKRADKPVEYEWREYDARGNVIGRKTIKRTANRLTSKERALSEIPFMIQDGVIGAASEILAKAQAERDQEVAARAERDRQREENIAADRARREMLDQVKADGAEALTEIRDIFGAALTNFQTDALINVIKLLRGEL